MNKSTLLLFAALLCFVFSCKENGTTVVPQIDHLFFSVFESCLAGEGDCASNFLLREGKLYEDVNEVYLQADSTSFDANFSQFKFEELDSIKYEIARELIEQFPSELLEENKPVPGCRQCLTDGGIYIDYNIKGVSGTLRVPLKTSHLPSYIHSYSEKILDKISMLKEAERDQNANAPYPLTCSALVSDDCSITTDYLLFGYQSFWCPDIPCRFYTYKHVITEDQSYGLHHHGRGKLEEPYTDGYENNFTVADLSTECHLDFKDVLSTFPEELWEMQDSYPYLRFDLQAFYVLYKQGDRIGQWHFYPEQELPQHFAFLHEDLFCQ